MWAAPALGNIGVELTLLVLAALGLALILRLREAPAHDVAGAAGAPSERPAVPTVLTAAGLAPRELSPKELARRADDSKYGD